jgi:hypothetical protein
MRRLIAGFWQEGVLTPEFEQMGEPLGTFG